MKTGVSISPRRVCRIPARALLEASVLRRVKGDKELTGIKGIKKIKLEMRLLERRVKAVSSEKSRASECAEIVLIELPPKEKPYPFYPRHPCE
jgi:hypothetical protein